MFSNDSITKSRVESGRDVFLALADESKALDCFPGNPGCLAEAGTGRGQDFSQSDDCRYGKHAQVLSISSLTIDSGSPRLRFGTIAFQNLDSGI